jgi:hypothetical protein
MTSHQLLRTIGRASIIAFTSCVSACSSASEPDVVDAAGVWSGDLDDPALPECMRLAIHAVSNALGVAGTGLALQGYFVECGTGQIVFSGLGGVARSLTQTSVSFDVGLSVMVPSAGGDQPAYRLELTQEPSGLVGTWRLRGDTASPASRVRLQRVVVNGSLEGRYILGLVRAPVGFQQVIEQDTMRFGSRGSLYRAGCDRTALGEYSVTSGIVRLLHYFPTCGSRTRDSLRIQDGTLVRRLIFIRIGDPTKRDTVEEVYYRR